MLKVGLLGAGYLGKIHLKLLKESNKYDLIGFYDVDSAYSNQIEKEFNCKYFSSIVDLLNEVEVVDIVTPTSTHFLLAKEAIKLGKHVFIEKPVTKKIEEAVELIELAKHNKVKVQVGHVERFNPAFLAVKDKINNPKFIETHRLATFNPRGTDVSVVLDLMIHDLDIILSIVKSKVKEIKSSGVSIISKSPDITNARIEFENGCVANITTSRISMKQMRKTRIFQEDAYISIDFLEKKSELIVIKEIESNNNNNLLVLENNGVKKSIDIQFPIIQANNAILSELESFADAIINDEQEEVTLTDAKNALEVALKIIENLK